MTETPHFYKPKPMRTLAEIQADILALENETEGLLALEHETKVLRAALAR